MPATSAPGHIVARYRRLSLGAKIMVFMVLGAILGGLLGERVAPLQPVGDAFIRLLIMAAIPLIVFNLLAGIGALSDVRTLGRVGGKILAFFFGTTLVALGLGIGAMQWLRPGDGLQIGEAGAEAAARVPRLADILLDLIPPNVFAALAEGRVVQIVIFSVVFGIAVVAIPGERRRPLQLLFDDLARAMRKLVDLILVVAPIGIGALAATTVGVHGARLLGPLAVFVLGVWAAQLVMIGVYLGLLAVFTRSSPLDFLRRTAPLYATTAATCSSMASLVVAFEMAEERLRLPNGIYSFTLPLGAQIHKDGSAIMLVGVLLLTAQAAGVEFTAGSYVTILLTGLLLSTGGGGVPAGGLVVAMIYVEAFGLPLEIAVIVSGIYRLVDMGNTTVNMMGDLVGTAIVARSEARNA